MKDIPIKNSELGNSTLVTAPEIMFFWVARMIISDMNMLEIMSFNSVYYTLKQSNNVAIKGESLGNSPHPLFLTA